MCLTQRHCIAMYSLFKTDVPKVASALQRPAPILSSPPPVHGCSPHARRQSDASSFCLRAWQGAVLQQIQQSNHFSIHTYLFQVACFPYLQIYSCCTRSSSPTISQHLFFMPTSRASCSGCEAACIARRSCAIFAFAQSRQFHPFLHVLSTMVQR